MIRSVWSFLVTVATLLFMSTTCQAEPLRLIVAVGHRFGFPGDAPLKHAARDATRVRDVFVDLGGVRPEHATVLLEPNRAALFATIDKLAALANGRRREDVSVLFYFSGHGDREALHLGLERLSLRDLDGKLAAIPAALRLVVTDACRTSDLRGKGVASTDPFAITLDAESGASGVIRLHASTDGEIAQESDELQAAVFTHYWLSGLSGAADANGDARVTFSESYAFAYNQTLFRSARTSGVVQRPAVEATVREGAPIVLTRTTSTTRLKLPRGADHHYIVYGVGSRTVAGELWSSSERSVVLAVAPGKYIVHRRAGGHSAATQIDVGKNEERELRASDFRAVPEETLARKGSELVLFPSELSLGYAARTGRLYDVGHELSFRYEHASNAFAIGLGAMGGGGSLDRTTREATVSWLGAEAIAEVRSRLGDVTLRAGAGPRVVALVQSLRRTDAARLALAGYDSEQRFRGATLGGHVLLGARLALGSRTWVDLDARGELSGLRMQGSLAATWTAGIGTAVGMSF